MLRGWRPRPPTLQNYLGSEYLPTGFGAKPSNYGVITYYFVGFRATGHEKASVEQIRPLDADDELDSPLVNIHYDELSEQSE